MSHETGSFLAVFADDLPKTPATFQEYVNKYFAVSHCAKGKYFWAIATISSPEKGWEKGLAPCHGVDLAAWPGLFEWLADQKRERATEKSLILHGYASWGHCDGSCFADGD